MYPPNDWKRPRPSELAFLLVLLLIQVALVAYLMGGCRQLQNVRTGLTVVAPSLERVVGELSPYGSGFERELVALFAEREGIPVRWIMVSSWEEAWDVFTSGRADLLIAPGYRPPDGMLADDIRQGPVYFSHPAYMLHNKWRYGLREPKEICSSEIFLSDNPALADGLSKEAALLGCGDPLLRRDQDSLLSILDELSANQMRFSAAEGGRFQVLEPFYPDLRKAGTFGQTIEHRWLWNNTNQAASEALERFWEDIQSDPKFLNLKDRYFGFFPKSTDYFELHHFFSVLRRKLPEYIPALIKAAKTEAIDPLLLVALIYKESAFDPEATSSTGVRGLLQLTRVTAEELQVSDRLDPEASLHAGARYLRILWKRFDGLPLDPWDRWFLALSAYNQGMGHTRDAIGLAERLGKNGLFWRELKTVYPLLSYSRYYKETSSGYARGYEAVDYVESIRYYYYILHGLIVLGRPEGNYLSPLFEAIPAQWP
jgi:membrane-bound lytic murein transglycosylase F